MTKKVNLVPVLEKALAEPQMLVFELNRVVENTRFDRESDRKSARDSIAKLSTLLKVRLTMAPGEMTAPVPAGGLAQWQVVQLQAYIDRRIDRKLTVSELGSLIRLSPSHFARAFKKTFQETPHNYVVRRRMVQVKYLLVSTSLPLQEIALQSGFSDQTHLCKSFKKSVGETPATWRRYRA